MTELFLELVFSIAWHFTARTSPNLFTERRGIMYVSENIRSGLRKVKLKIKYPGRLEKTQI
jgi:hypothetical protein